jgi:hypothetical protein
LLSIAEAEAGAAPSGDAGGAGATGGESERAGVARGEARRAAAREALRALGEVAAAGALGSGVVVTGELLRTLHAARVSELPRLSSAVLRVASGVRACRERSERFELAPFAADLGDALACAHALGRGAGPDLARWIGTARRSYTRAGTLRLHGLASEPVVTGSGYAGVVTYLVDARGAVLTLADVAPGDATRVPLAYAGAARLGGGTLTHRELCRSGLFIEGATVSAEGRLGAGQGVRAVLAPASDWSAPPFDALFRRPLLAQVRDGFEALDVGADRAGLLLFDGVLRGASEEALRIEVPDAPGTPVLDAVPASPLAALPFHDNLRLLAQRAGIRLRLVGRLVPSRALRLQLLALGPPPGADGLALPPDWAGRCNLGLDRLAGAAFVDGGAPAPAGLRAEPARTADALLPLTRRLERLALGGRATFAGAAERVEREARALEQDLMPCAAAVLRALCATALDRGPDGAERLAMAAAGASEYLGRARRAIELGAWAFGLGGLA